MIKDKLFIINALKDEIEMHNFQSGEIILELDSVKNANDKPIKNIAFFFSEKEIKTEKTHFDLEEMTASEAVAAIAFGLSVKPNYTVIDEPFSVSEQQKLAHCFVALFVKPTFYRLTTRIFQADLDLNDFWESHGTIVLDKHHIGIFWTNDLYGKFGGK